MASNKDKLLESAQNNLKKKQIVRAIKDYAKIVEIDPADIRSRQKLADLYARTNKNVEAFEQYEAIGKYFSSNGFYLKAIAIYKQMQRLDPSQMSLFNRLAELNEKQGLIGNAMAEYRNLANYYERNGMIADAIKTLEKMRELDSANLNVRVKLAEIYALNKHETEGLVEFEGVLEILGKKSEFDKILKLYKIFLPLFPNNKKLKMGLALTLYEKGELTLGISILANLLKDNPANPDILRLLARGYDDLKEWERAQKTYQQLLGFDPSDLDIREALIRCYINSGRYPQALAELEEWKDAFVKSERVDSLKGFYEQLKNYLPKNSQVMQTLDSIYELTGDGDKILDIMGENEPAPRTVIVEETLSDSLLGSAIADIEAPTIDLGFEDEFVELAEESAEEPVFAVPAEESDFDLQLEPIDEAVAEVEPAEEFLEFNLSDSSRGEASAEDDLEFSFDLDGDELVAEAATEELHDLRADLEEAEFYIQQGLYADAEKLCRAILAYAPDSIDCQQKLAVILPYLSGSGQEPSSGLQDLAAELLSDEFSGFPDLSDLAPEVSSPAVKKVFRTDVDEQIAADDMESHYNLGIAYREMGLLDDAISEFAKGQKDPARFVDCLTLQGLCFSDKGDYVNAEKLFRQALDSEHLEEDQRLSLGYELGSLYERSAQPEQAYASYQSVLEQDASYRDVQEKVAALQQQLSADVATAEPIEAKKERISFL